MASLDPCDRPTAVQRRARRQLIAFCNILHGEVNGGRDCEGYMYDVPAFAIFPVSFRGFTPIQPKGPALTLFNLMRRKGVEVIL